MFDLWNIILFVLMTEYN